MRKYTLGELLYRFRMERNMEAQQICWGLCVPSMMSFFEKGEYAPDTLMFECMVERMSISPESFSIMVSEEEYEYHEWRELVFKGIEEENWDKVGILLQSQVTGKTYCNEKLEKQFYLYASAVYFASKQGYEKAHILLGEAIKLTMPDIRELTNNRVVLCAQELHILMLYLHYGIMGKAWDLETGRVLFDILEHYISVENLDITEKAKCYPKLVCIGIHCFSEIMTDEKQMSLCEKALQVLRDGRKFHDITELLRLYVPMLQKHNCKELAYYRKHYEVFCDLLESEGISTEFKPEAFSISKPKIYIISEYLLSKRKENKMTQVKLSDGICEPETYSRIENGKRAPSKRNFIALAERLDINWCYFCGELDTSERKAFELRKKAREANIREQRERALEILLQLEACVDMELVQNQQYVSSNIYMAKYHLGLLSGEETYKKLEALLHLTQNMGMSADKLVYYTQTELEIIGFMAQVLRRQGRYEEGTALIVLVLKQMSNSKVGIENQWNGFEFLLRILGGLYFAKEDYETSLKIANYVKHMFIKKRDGSNLSAMLDAIADDLEHIGAQYSKKYKKLYRYTYYTSDFFGLEKVMNFIKQYYEKKFDSNIIWYED